MYGALLLAAGASRRMGSPKALLDIGGRTALERCVEAARAVAGDVVVVLGHHADAIAPRVPPGARIVRNPAPEAGRTGSIQCGVAALPAVDAVFVHPVDVPFVTASDYRALLDARAAARGATAFVPTHAGRGGHPLLLDASRIPELLALAPDTPLRALLDARPSEVCRVPVANAGVTLDLNTPDDYRAALARHTPGGAPPAARAPP